MQDGRDDDEIGGAVSTVHIHHFMSVGNHVQDGEEPGRLNLYNPGQLVARGKDCSTFYSLEGCTYLVGPQNIAEVKRCQLCWTIVPRAFPLGIKVQPSRLGLRGGDILSGGNKLPPGYPGVAFQANVADDEDGDG